MSGDDPEIEAAIARADVTLLLVSPEFLASDVIVDEELLALIRRACDSQRCCCAPAP